jgi:hypothetical protein
MGRKHVKPEIAQIRQPQGSFVQGGFLLCRACASAYLKTVCIACSTYDTLFIKMLLCS